MRIYLAGKIQQNCWRHNVVAGLHDASSQIGEDWPVLHRAINGSYDYVGPYFAATGHAVDHGNNTHGNWTLIKDDHGGISNGAEVTSRCLSAIRRSDLFFAWLSDATAHGTLVEIGYALALSDGPEVVVGYPKVDPDSDEYFALDDMWFAFTVAPSQVVSETPEGALALAIKRASAPKRTAPHRLVVPDAPIVYFIQELGGENRIKIGKSRADALATRLSSLQTGSSERLVIRTIVTGGLDIERWFHDRFGHLRVRGEWFSNHPDILATALALGGR